MKRLFEDNKGNILLTALVILLGMMLGFAVYGTFHGAEAIIGGSGNVTDSGNPHNLSAGSGGVQATSEKRICIFCHVSHGAITNTDLGYPLWNHSLSSQTYKVLASGTVVNSITDSKYYPALGVANAGIVNMLSSPASPDGSSRLCLSCHDGTVAIGAISSESVDIAMDTSSSCLDSTGKLVSCTSSLATGAHPYIGNDLTTKHVVSIPMNDSLIAASLNNCGVAGQTTKLQYPWYSAVSNRVSLRPTMKQYGGSYGIDASSYDTQYGAGYYYGVQCSTCHDPHFWGSVVNSAGYKFIGTDNFDDLCTACHIPC